MRNDTIEGQKELKLIHELSIMHLQAQMKIQNIGTILRDYNKRVFFIKQKISFVWY